jgi:hypothetical protein
MTDLSDLSSHGTNHDSIPSFGIDADPEARPGVPMEREPHPFRSARQPVQQRTVIGITGTQLPGQPLTPVYGTAQPPRGLSGVLRRKAYRIPPHLDSHWLLLLMADRIDSLEHRPGRLAGMALVLGGLVAGGLSLGRRRRR